MWTPENRGLYARPGLRYPSDLTDAEWDLVRPFLRRRTRSGPAPERLREILNAVLYVFPIRATAEGAYGRGGSTRPAVAGQRRNKAV
jgi:transposase